MSGEPKEYKNLTRTHKWQPGQSGNPLGMDPRLAKLTRKCKLYAIRGAEVCREIMEDQTKSPFARLQAVALLWDRGHGKPRETVDVNANVTVGTTWTSLVAEAHKALEARKAATIQETVIDAVMTEEK